MSDTPPLTGDQIESAAAGALTGMVGVLRVVRGTAHRPRYPDTT